MDIHFFYLISFIGINSKKKKQLQLNQLLLTTTKIIKKELFFLSRAYKFPIKKFKINQI